MKIKLSTFRRICALVLFMVGTLFLLQPPFLKFDSWDFFPRIQLVPALLAGTAVILIALVVLTLLFGRLYCSVICPLGVFQDLIIRLNRKRIKRNKTLSKARRAYRYEKPEHIMRYSILGLVLLSLVSGSTLMLIFLDPYSIYTRLSTHLLHPVITALNNLLARILNAFDNYALTVEHYLLPSMTVLLITLLFAGTLIALSIKKDRFWCNAICPVGTGLGLLSKVALFKVSVDRSACVSCGKCASECKSHAIDEKRGFRIDYSRCVSCYNCIDSCSHKNAVRIGVLRLMNSTPLEKDVVDE